MKDIQDIIPIIVDWLEVHLEEDNILDKVSEYVGYSPWYVSMTFHEVTGISLRAYVVGRRLSKLAGNLAESDMRIIDLAVKYGYSSQEAFTRAFKTKFGVTPVAYRKNPIPIRMQSRKSQEFQADGKEDTPQIDFDRLTVTVEHIPAHRYLGIWEKNADNYADFWKYHDAEEVRGFVDSCDKLSHDVVTAHTAGWKWENGRKIFFYGSGMPLAYTGPVPIGFELREFPASDYLVFAYPTFDYMKENGVVTNAVDYLAWNFDPIDLGYEWNEDGCQDYMRHCPEKIGYQILRPVKRI